MSTGSAASLFSDRNPNLYKNLKQCPNRKRLLGVRRRGYERHN
jgi:hypothetical protein